MFDPDSLNENEKLEKQWRRTDRIMYGAVAVMLIVVLVSWWMGL